MTTEDEIDTSRTAVKTYVPAYQKDIWSEHAESLGMSQSEFVRTMVQAGRRGFDPGNGRDSIDDEGANEKLSPGDELADQIVSVLEESGPLEWDSLVDHLTEDLEDRLDETLQLLQDDNTVRYSGRDGGYTVIENR